MLVIATQHPVPVLPGTAKDGAEFIDPAPAEPVEVQDHPYYHRRIGAGELRQVKGKAGAKATAKSEGEA